MVRIAVHAGLPQNLELVNEPEAAAILCFVEDIGNSLEPSSSAYSGDETPETPDRRSSSKVNKSSTRSLLVEVAPERLTKFGSSLVIGIHLGS